MKKISYKKAYVISLIFIFISCIIFSSCGLSQEDQSQYDEILELSLKQVSSKNWKYTGKAYPWDTEVPNYHNQFFFYIDENIYDEYKTYWLEGISKDEYKNGYNNGLYSYGKYVQYCINIQDNISEKDLILYDIPLTQLDTTIYKVSIYDKSLFYIYANKAYGDNDTVILEKYFDVDNESCICQMYVYKQKDNWIITEILKEDWI